MMAATVLRRLADGHVVNKTQRDELLTAIGDLSDELINLADALTELDEAEPSARRDARELVTDRADDVLGELAAVGLIAPRLGNAEHTGRELTLDRLAKRARAAMLAAPGEPGTDERVAAAERAAVEAVLVEVGYLPAGAS